MKPTHASCFHLAQNCLGVWYIGFSYLFSLATLLLILIVFRQLSSTELIQHTRLRVQREWDSLKKEICETIKEKVEKTIHWGQPAFLSFTVEELQRESTTELLITLYHAVLGSFSSVQSLSCVRLFATPWTAARQASLSITNSWSSPKPMSIESVMPSNHLILCRPLLLLPPMPPSSRVFSNESALRMRWPKYWCFSLSISPSNEHRGLISFRMDWLDLLAVQGTLKSVLQHHSSKASILWHLAFFTVQLLYPYMTTGKTIALTRRTFVGKVTSLLFKKNINLFILIGG